MSGGLFFFFWEADAPVAPPPPPPPPDPGAGGGASRGEPDSYIPFTDQYWDEREAYLQALFDRAHPQPNVAEDYEARANEEYERRKKQIAELNAERATLIIQLRKSTTVAAMKAAGARIAAINAKIHELQGKQAVTRFMH
jgi:hypothetical protein